MARPSAKRQAAPAVDVGYMAAWARPCFLETTLGAVPLLALHPHLVPTLVVSLLCSFCRWMYSPSASCAGSA
jgi:hypothetical protein